MNHQSKKSSSRVAACSLTFEEVEQSGEAAEPLAFDAPRVESAFCQDILAWDPRTGNYQLCVGVICREEEDHEEDTTGGDDNLENRDPTATRQNRAAYWPQKRLQMAIYGSVWACSVLRLRPHDDQGCAFWEITQEQVAIKKLDLAMIKEMRHELAEDPIQEIAAMQFLDKSNSDHVATSRHVLQDDEYLYSVMDFCRDGDLLDLVNRYAHQSVTAHFAMPEPVARHCFRQILEGVACLQQHGICHRDLSLGNVMVHEGTCKIIDFGMCLRIPFANPKDENIITDAAHGTTRRLMTPQGTCGKWKYMSPEVQQDKDSIDGFAVDLWSVGVILFIMLNGCPPETGLATRWDNGAVISGEARGLLEHMLREDPRERLTLAQIWAHPWVAQGETQAPEVV